ncbi:hypothetical protein MSAN_01750000 [Mycena sanguinolenta]|uniref:Uncharacterized protein n=1 Tax=Mycena sanguinolenta TaxID=230812 RepID=A0A8H7CRV5_9AGAR|nr:hypothetical protein MSAN_01750000 [Mycena sanguinolenta]
MPASSTSLHRPPKSPRAAHSQSALRCTRACRVVGEDNEQKRIEGSEDEQLLCRPGSIRSSGPPQLPSLSSKRRRSQRSSAQWSTIRTVRRAVCRRRSSYLPPILVPEPDILSGPPVLCRLSFRSSLHHPSHFAVKRGHQELLSLSIIYTSTCALYIPV